MSYNSVEYGEYKEYNRWIKRFEYLKKSAGVEG